MSILQYDTAVFDFLDRRNFIFDYSESGVAGFDDESGFHLVVFGLQPSLLLMFSTDPGSSFMAELQEIVTRIEEYADRTGMQVLINEARQMMEEKISRCGTSNAFFDAH